MLFCVLQISIKYSVRVLVVARHRLKVIRRTEIRPTSRRFDKKMFSSFISIYFLTAFLFFFFVCYCFLFLIKSGEWLRRCKEQHSSKTERELVWIKLQYWISKLTVLSRTEILVKGAAVNPILVSIAEHDIFLFRSLFLFG